MDKEGNSCISRFIFALNFGTKCQFEFRQCFAQAKWRQPNSIFASARLAKPNLGIWQIFSQANQSKLTLAKLRPTLKACFESIRNQLNILT